MKARLEVLKREYPGLTTRQLKQLDRWPDVDTFHWLDGDTTVRV